MSSSGQPIPLRSAPSHGGRAMRIPIYRNGMPVTTVAERRQACIGSVGLGFSVPRLVDVALGEMPVRAVRVALRDSSSIGRPATLLFDSQPKMPGAESGHFIKDLPVQFHVRTWHAQFSVPKRAL